MSRPGLRWTFYFILPVWVDDLIILSKLNNYVINDVFTSRETRQHRYGTLQVGFRCWSELELIC